MNARGAVTTVGPRRVLTIEVAFEAEPGEWAVAVRPTPSSSWRIVATGTGAGPTSIGLAQPMLVRDVRVSWSSPSGDESPTVAVL